MEIHAFSQFLSATMGPSVARVSAPRTMPSLNTHPTMVVPVLVALGKGTPLLRRKLFLERHEKHNQETVKNIPSAI